MKVLITGGAGFIGSNLTERLLDLNWQISIIDDLSTGKLSNLHKVLNRVEFVQEDIQNHEILNKLI